MYNEYCILSEEISSLLLMHTGCSPLYLSQKAVDDWWFNNKL